MLKKFWNRVLADSFFLEWNFSLCFSTSGGSTKILKLGYVIVYFTIWANNNCFKMFTLDSRKESVSVYWFSSVLIDMLAVTV